MWKNLSLEQFQKDLDDGWEEYCDDRIYHLRRLSLTVQSINSQNYLERQIKHFKVLRRMR